MWTNLNEPTLYENMSLIRTVLCMLVVYVKKITDWIQYAAILTLMAPYKMADIGLFRPTDKNALHPKRLSGENVVYWINESDVKTPLLQTIQVLRRQFVDVRFNDIVATVVSRGLESYFKYKAIKPPSNVTILVPERIAGESKSVTGLSSIFLADILKQGSQT